MGLTQNRPGGVAPPCRTFVLPASACLAGTILRQSWWIRSPSMLENYLSGTLNSHYGKQ